MKTETFKGTIESAYGEKLPKALAFSGTYDAFTSYDEIPDDTKPTQQEIVDFVNAKLKANARQKSMNAVLTEAGISKPTLEDSPELRIKSVVKSLMASGKYTAQHAEDLAKQMLG